MGRGAARESQLAADVAVTVDQRDRIAMRGGLDGGGHARRAGANDQHAQRPGRAGAAGQRALATGAGIDQAADRHARVVVADAGLVAADAGEHVSPAALRRLLDEVGIGDQRPRHPDRVGRA